MAVDDKNATTTRLLTLLNVSATKSLKRKLASEEPQRAEKLNKRRNVQSLPMDEERTAGQASLSDSEQDAQGEGVNGEKENEVDETIDELQGAKGSSVGSVLH